MEIGTILPQAARSRDLVPSLPAVAEKAQAAPQVAGPKVTQVTPLPGEKKPEPTIKPVQTLTNAYAVSDRRFTIYKAPSGEYITRFTNLRDGRVTYVPEQDMVTFLNAYRLQPEPRLEIIA